MVGHETAVWTWCLDQRMLVILRIHRWVCRCGFRSRRRVEIMVVMVGVVMSRFPIIWVVVILLTWVTWVTTWWWSHSRRRVSSRRWLYSNNNSSHQWAPLIIVDEASQTLGMLARIWVITVSIKMLVQILTLIQRTTTSITNNSSNSCNSRNAHNRKIITLIASINRISGRVTGRILLTLTTTITTIIIIVKIDTNNINQ